MAQTPDKDVPDAPAPDQAPAPDKAPAPDQAPAPPEVRPVESAQAQGPELPSGAANATGLPRRRAEAATSSSSRSQSVSPVARKFPLSQALLLLNTVLVLFLVGGLVFLFSYPAPEEPPSTPAVSPLVQAPVGSEPTSQSQPAGTPGASALADVPVHAEPLTWEQAESFHAKGRFDQCLPIYEQLVAVADRVPSQAMVADFFRLRAAECLVQLGRLDEAGQLLEALDRSGSPAVVAAANYWHARLSLGRQHYHTARLQAYRALAALGSLEIPQPLEADCDYLIAMSMTRQALAFGDRPLALDSKEPPPHDPFAGLDRQGLQRFLKEGSEGIGAAALGPAIWRLDEGSIGRRWVTSCTLTSVEEMLQRFASQAGLDVQWDEVSPAVRQRAISLCLQGVSEQRFVEIAAGLAGLTARYTGQGVVVHDLQAQTSLARQRELLTQTGVMAWRRFGLRYSEDPRVGRSHFALANLLEGSGESAAALSSYQVLSRRFPNDGLAPSALLASAMLRIHLRDYSGARTDLLDLLDRYPSNPSFEQVYLKLGQATYEAGMADEAARVYTRLYHLDVSVQTKLHSCLGAAQCCFEQKDYPQTIEWVKRYRELSDGDGGKELAAAYVVRAQAAGALGDMQQAREYFTAALSAGPSRQHYILSLLELARLDLQAGRMTNVLGALARLEELPLDQEQLFSTLVISSRAYRAMGLSAVAVRTLRGRLGSMTDLALRARLQVEYAHCLQDDGDDEGARAVLEQALPLLPAGSQTDDASCDLAGLCLKSGRIDQAITMTGKALDRPMEPAQRQRALEILGSAYLQRKEYPRAAQAFAGLLADRTEGQVQP